jgi:hypothetical protein
VELHDGHPAAALFEPHDFVRLAIDDRTRANETRLVDRFEHGKRHRRARRFDQHPRPRPSRSRPGDTIDPHLDCIRLGFGSRSRRPGMEAFEQAPLVLLVVAASAILVGAIPLAWMAARFLRFVRRHPQPRVSMARYLMAIATSSLLLGIGVGASGLAVALEGYRAFTAKSLVAEVQCIELEPAKLRLYFVPIADDGKRGVQETYDLDGEEWMVAGEVLRFRSFLTPLGVNTVHKVTRIEGRWLRAEDAGAHLPTVFDRDGGRSKAWLFLLRHGARGPLGFLIDGVHGQAVSQLPDRRALFDLYVTPNGYVLDKKTL